MSSISYGNNADSYGPLTLSAHHLQSLFPFHIVFDAEMRIIHHGDRLARLCPTLKTGDLFSEHFQVHRPERIDDFESISRQLGALYVVRLRSAPTELKGQMVLLQENLILFLCSPLVRGIAEVQALGLSLQDFPLHDPVGDLLFLLQAQHTTIEEAKALNRRLLAEVQKVASLNEVFKKYVPQEFLKLLEKESIVHVRLGDNVQKTMTVLFSDIRSFTTLSESMSPQETFKFINSYLQHMEPIFGKHGGFIDKYIGDGIMALFATAPDHAVKAALDMLYTLVHYNQGRQRAGYIPIRIGIGINTGSLMLGTIGGENRMDSTVISDAVNLASRIEDLTKMYGAPLLISEKTFFSLETPLAYSVRVVGHVRVKGKSELITVFEVFDGDAPEVKEAKCTTLKLFEEAVDLYYRQEFREAHKLFLSCCNKNPHDQTAKIYLEHCQQMISAGQQAEWNGITKLDTK
jgi:class 3 adenylate cyclase